MAGTRFLDAVARFPNCSGVDADATSAFTQLTLEDAGRYLGIGVVPKTWITLPKDRQPASWQGIEDPVCPLIGNLYGHPLAGLLWDKCSQERIKACGFEKVRSWESMYVHKAKGLFLGVYVDDFHMAGRTEHMEQAWKDLRAVIDFGDSTDFNNTTYLGCQQQKIDPPLDLIQEKQELFTELLKESKMQTAQDFQEKGFRVPNAKPKNKSKKKISDLAMVASTKDIQAWAYVMQGAAAGCVERYLELSGKKISDLKQVSTPCIDDHLLAPEDFVNKGILSTVCSKAVLKCLYMTRSARPELYWAVNALAREVTKWNVACDKRLHRLMCYIKYNQEVHLACYVGDKPSQCKLVLFCDASFAGDLKDSRSTSGALMCLMGPNTYVPLSWICKKQGAISHSSTEAEIIALELGLRSEGIRALDLWETILDTLEPIKTPVKPPTNSIAENFNKLPLDHQILLSVDYVTPSIPMSSGRGKLYILEDNDAVIKMCVKGRAPNMTHIPRVHRVDTDWMFERILLDPGIQIKYVNTKQQIADIFTKGSFTEQTWKTLCRLLQMVPSKKL